MCDFSTVEMAGSRIYYVIIFKYHILVKLGWQTVAAIYFKDRRRSSGLSTIVNNSAMVWNHCIFVKYFKIKITLIYLEEHVEVGVPDLWCTDPSPQPIKIFI